MAKIFVLVLTFAPLLAIALPLLQKWPRIGWALWIIATLVTAIYWISFLQETHDVHAASFSTIAFVGTIISIVTFLSWLKSKRRE